MTSAATCRGGLAGRPTHTAGVGLAGLAVSGLGVHDRGVGRRETALFRAVNELPDGLPDGLFVPAWVLMQSGSLGAGPAVAALSWASGRPRLAARLALGGIGSWALSKAIKAVYRRPWPSLLVDGVRSRGSEASGLGYVSGPAGVAVALGVAAFGELGRAGRLAMLRVVPGVGLCRIYVGAHLPLDVVGGAAMGLAVDAAVQLATDLVAARPLRRPGPQVRPVGRRPTLCGRSRVEETHRLSRHRRARLVTWAATDRRRWDPVGGRARPPTAYAFAPHVRSKPTGVAPAVPGLWCVGRDR